EGLPSATLRLEGSDLGQGTDEVIPVKSNQLRNVRVFVTMPRKAISADSTEFSFKVTGVDTKDTSSHVTQFAAPGDIGN
ncbi:MAG: FixG Ig-like domain-containing protein, partial [Anderseniella sp.]